MHAGGWNKSGGSEKIDNYALTALGLCATTKDENHEASHPPCSGLVYPEPRRAYTALILNRAQHPSGRYLGVNRAIGLGWGAGAGT